MKRRIGLMLTGMTLLGLAIAIPQTAFAQSDPLLGTWQLNLAKSRYSAPAPKSSTVYFQAEGQNRKGTAVGIDAAGNPTVLVAPSYNDDGKPNLMTATPAIAYDVTTNTRVDAYTVNFSRTKAGREVQTGTRVVSQDGRTLTFTVTGTGANGEQINNIAVYEKQ
jgi:hypothetical protein